jgi:hypothetical protein
MGGDASGEQHLGSDGHGDDRPRPASVLVALNSLFQIVAFAALGCFYLRSSLAGSA